MSSYYSEALQGWTEAEIQATMIVVMDSTVVLVLLIFPYEFFSAEFQRNLYKLYTVIQLLEQNKFKTEYTIQYKFKLPTQAYCTDVALREALCNQLHTEGCVQLWITNYNGLSFLFTFIYDCTCTLLSSSTPTVLGILWG